MYGFDCRINISKEVMTGFFKAFFAGELKILSSEEATRFIKCESFSRWNSYILNNLIKIISNEFSDLKVLSSTFFKNMVLLIKKKKKIFKDLGFLLKYTDLWEEKPEKISKANINDIFYNKNTKIYEKLKSSKIIKFKGVEYNSLEENEIFKIFLRECEIIQLSDKDKWVVSKKDFFFLKKYTNIKKIIICDEEIDLSKINNTNFKNFCEYIKQNTNFISKPNKKEYKIVKNIVESIFEKKGQGYFNTCNIKKIIWQIIEDKKRFKKIKKIKSIGFLRFKTSYFYEKIFSYFNFKKLVLSETIVSCFNEKILLERGYIYSVEEVHIINSAFTRTSDLSFLTIFRNLKKLKFTACRLPSLETNCENEIDFRFKLQVLSKIETLVLKKCLLSGKILIEYLNGCQSLKKLICCENPNIGWLDKSNIKIGRFVETLEVLVMRKCNIHTNPLNHIISKFLKLRKLDFSYNNGLGSFSGKFFCVGESRKTLKSLKISNSDFNGLYLSTILSNLEVLEYLSISGNNYILNNEFFRTCNFKYSKYTLKKLNIHSCGIDEGTFMRLLYNFNNLKNVNASFNTFYFKERRLSIGSSSKTLEKLILKNCDLSYHHLLNIFEECEKLKHLNLAGNKYLGYKIGEGFSFKKSKNTLESLNISACSINCYSLSYLIKSCQNLKKLNISSNVEIYGPSLRNLEFGASKTTLKHLNVKFCLFEKNTLSQLVNKFDNLEKIIANNNFDITDTVTSENFNYGNSKDTIKHLDIGSNHLSSDDLLFFSNELKNLKILKVYDNYISSDAILEAIKQVNVIKNLKKMVIHSIKLEEKSIKRIKRHFKGILCFRIPRNFNSDHPQDLISS